MKNELKQAALAYAREKHWPIFPCNKDKEPLTRNGVLDATTNAAQIEDWWDTWPGANIGLNVGGAGMMVIDYDPGADEDMLAKSVGKLPDTDLVANTPRGGEHEFYTLKNDEVVAPSSSKLADNIDVRSYNSYVLLAPSSTADGNYTWAAEGKPGFRSEEMVRVSNAAMEKHRDREKWIIEADLPEHKDQAVKWLKTEAKIAVESKGGGGLLTYATAGMMHSFGLTEEVACELMWEHWNPRCDPPWDADDYDYFAERVKNGYRYHTSPPGNMTKAYQVALNADLFQPIAPKEGEDPGGHDLPTGGGRFTFWTRSAMNTIKPPKWMLKGTLPLGGYCLLVGGYGTYKTFIALDIALSIATADSLGDPKRGTDTWPVAMEHGKVLFAAGEGKSNLTKRVRAWEQMYLDDGQEATDFFMAAPVPSPHEDDFDEFIAHALSVSPEGYSLVVLDTVGKSMAGLDPNSAEAASRFSLMVETMQSELGATVIGIGHTGHGNDDRQMGSRVFGNDADTIIMVNQVKDKLVRLRMEKQKDAPEWKEHKLLAMREEIMGMPTEDDDMTSLVAVEPSKEDVGAPPGDGKAMAAHQIALAVDKAAVGVLEAVPGRRMHQKELASMVAYELGTMSEEEVGKILTKIRSFREMGVHKFYDPQSTTQKWRHVK